MIDCQNIQNATRTFYAVDKVYDDLAAYKFQYPTSITNFKRALYCVKDLYSEFGQLDTELITNTNIFLKRVERVFDNVMEYLAFQLDSTAADATQIVAAFRGCIEYMAEFIWFTLYYTVVYDTPAEMTIEQLDRANALQELLGEFQAYVKTDLIPAAEKYISYTNANDLLDSADLPT